MCVRLNSFRSHYTPHTFTVTHKMWKNSGGEIGVSSLLIRGQIELISPEFFQSFCCHCAPCPGLTRWLTWNLISNISVSNPDIWNLLCCLERVWTWNLSHNETHCERFARLWKFPAIFPSSMSNGGCFLWLEKRLLSAQLLPPRQSYDTGAFCGSQGFILGNPVSRWEFCKVYFL